MELIPHVSVLDLGTPSLENDSVAYQHMQEAMNTLFRRFSMSCEVQRGELWQSSPPCWQPNHSFNVLLSLIPSRPCPPSHVCLTSASSSGCQSSATGRDDPDNTARIPGSQGAHQNNGSASGNTESGSAAPIGSDNIRSRGQDPSGEPPPEGAANLGRTFNLYEKTKSIREVNECIKEELVKAHPTIIGYVYGFLHPSNVRVRIGTGPMSDIQVIKIGRSVNVERRMRQWKKQCKYEPRVVLNVAMPHHYRIERIVHHQLHNCRLRESPGCSGCKHRHTEWFRVSTIYAEHLVSMWQNFAQRQPYDQFGDLLPGWLERLERVDLEDPGCWMWFILESPPAGLLSHLEQTEIDHSPGLSRCPSSDGNTDEPPPVGASQS